MVLLVSMTGAFASGAGSSSDPLVSQSYVDDDYTEAVLAQGGTAIDEGLTAVYTAYAGTLISDSEGYLLTSEYEQFWIPDGGSVTVKTGASFVVYNGSVSIQSLDGTVINVSTGEEISSSASLSAYRRYFCAEDTTVTLGSDGGAVVAVDGRYILASGAAEALQYSDVPGSAWYYEAAYFVYENELFYDYDDTKFRQGEALTRAEFVYALWALSGCPEPDGTASFTDVTDEWSIKAISWAEENGIVNGYGGGLFGPDDTIERQGIATMMYRYSDYMGESVSASKSLSAYTDVDDIGDWALTAMKWANAKGLITGMTDTTLEPKGTATRAQVATIIMRYAGE